MSEPTKAQREKLEHALGLDYPDKVRDGVTFRNYYCAEAGEGAADLESLVRLGLMRRGREINDGFDRYYHATKAGMALVGVKEVAP